MAALPHTVLPSNLESLTVAKLKELLKDRSLPVSGPKAVLIQRLRTHNQKEILVETRDWERNSYAIAPNQPKRILRQSIPNAIEAGDYKVVSNISRKLNDYAPAILSALEFISTKGSNVELLEALQNWIQEGGAPAMDLAMVEGAGLNLLEVLTLCIQMGGKCVWQASVAAASAGHMEMLSFLVGHWDRILLQEEWEAWCQELANAAIQANHFSLFEVIQTWGSKLNLEEIIIHAIRGHHRDLLENFLVEASPNVNYNLLLIEAAAEGLSDIVWMLLEIMTNLNQVPDYAQASFEAQDGGHLETVDVIMAHSGHPAQSMLLPPSAIPPPLRKPIPAKSTIIELD